MSSAASDKTREKHRSRRSWQSQDTIARSLPSGAISECQTQAKQHRTVRLTDAHAPRMTAEKSVAARRNQQNSAGSEIHNLLHEIAFFADE